LAAAAAPVFIAPSHYRRFGRFTNAEEIGTTFFRINGAWLRASVDQLLCVTNTLEGAFG
jgi:hypothetical protein